MTAADIAALLQRLELDPINDGAWSGSHGWCGSATADLITVRNPASGEPLAQVHAAGAEDLDHILDSAVAAAALWREVPAPRRGELIRVVAQELRRVK